MNRAPVCDLCYGSGKLRHERPLEVGIEKWRDYTGLGHCPLCRGTKVAQFVTHPVTQNQSQMTVYFVRLESGRVIAACPEASCTKWADANQFFERKFTPGEPFARCPDGHTIRMHLKFRKAEDRR